MNSLSSLYNTVQSFVVQGVSACRNTKCGQILLSKTTAVALLACTAYGLQKNYGVGFRKPYHIVPELELGGETYGIPAVRSPVYLRVSNPTRSAIASVGALFAAAAAVVVLFKKF
jgi:hypothetical protein